MPLPLRTLMSRTVTIPASVIAALVLLATIGGPPANAANCGDYPNIRRHFLDALRKGWPRTLVLNRSGADARHDRLLAPHPTRPGQDRDEYPPALGRGKGLGLEHLGPFESTLNTSGSTSSR